MSDRLLLQDGSTLLALQSGAGDLLLQSATPIQTDDARGSGNSAYSAFHRRALIAQILREEEEIVAIAG